MKKQNLHFFQIFEFFTTNPIWDLVKFLKNFEIFEKNFFSKNVKKMCLMHEKPKILKFLTIKGFSLYSLLLGLRNFFKKLLIFDFVIFFS